MRPNLVFALVLLAVGALVFVLLSGDRKAPSGGDAASSLTQREVSPGGARPQASLNTETLPAVVENRSSAVIEPEPSTVREVVGDAQVYGGQLVGTVRNQAGEPVAGALLETRRGAGNSGLAALQLLAGGPPDPTQTWSTRSNQAGEFKFIGIPPADNYVIAAKHQDYAAIEVPGVRVENSGESRRDVVMNDGFVVLGYVRDFNTGTPIAKARLRLVDLMLSTLPPDDPRVNSQTAVSDDAGLYRFDHVSPGTRALTASADGYGALIRNDVNVGGQPTLSVDFRMQVGVQMSGQVVTPGRQGILGARITAISDSGVNSQGRAVSGPDGRFKIEELTAGTYSLIADAPGWGTKRLNRIEADAQDVMIEMIQQGSAEGVVKERATGQPVPSFQAIVRAMIPNSTIYGRRAGAQDVKDSPTGGFLIGGLDNGQYVVEIRAEGYAPSYSEPFEVTQGLVASGIQVFLSAGGKLVGLVLDETTGEPIVGAEIKTFDNNYVHHALIDLLGANAPRTTTERSTRTDAGGRFELPNLWPDVYQVQITYPGRMTSILKDVRVMEGNTPTDMGKIKLGQGASLRGTVYDGAGQPMIGAMVYISNTLDPMGPKTQVTNTTGAFTFRNVPPGSYRAHATRPPDASDPFRSIVDMNSSQVTLTLYDGREVVQDLRIAN